MRPCPVTKWISPILSIIHHQVSTGISSLQPSMTILVFSPVEWFWREPIVIFSSLLVSMHVFLCLPLCFIKKLSISLEATGFSCAFEISRHGIVKFAFANFQFLPSIRFRSFIWTQVSLSHSGTPFFTHCCIRSDNALITIFGCNRIKHWPCLLHCLFFNSLHPIEILSHISTMSPSKVILFIEAPISYFSVGPSQF